jgi:hypothetical protein
VAPLATNLNKVLSFSRTPFSFGKTKELSSGRDMAFRDEERNENLHVRKHPTKFMPQFNEISIETTETYHL